MGNPVKLIDLYGLAPGDFFVNLDSAAVDFGNYTNPQSINENCEYSTAFYKITKDGVEGYSYTKPLKSEDKKAAEDECPAAIWISKDADGNFVASTKQISSEDELAVALGHTHGAYNSDYGTSNDIFSGIPLEQRGINNPEARKRLSTHDMGVYNSTQIQGYLVGTTGVISHYDPSTGNIRVLKTMVKGDRKFPQTLMNQTIGWYGL